MSQGMVPRVTDTAAGGDTLCMQEELDATMPVGEKQVVAPDTQPDSCHGDSCGDGDCCPGNTPTPHKSETPTGADADGINDHDEFETGRFEDVPLSEELLRGAYEYGLETPLPIQQGTLRPCLNGSHVLAQGRAGTGKTIAYVMAVLQQVDVLQSVTQIVVLTPTREIAWRVVRDLLAVGVHTGVRGLACVGGTGMRDMLKELAQGPHVVVGTPGRVMDCIGRGVLQTDSIRHLVVDEADDMMSKGFTDVACSVFGSLQKDVQVTIWTSTMSAELREVIGRMLPGKPILRVRLEGGPVEGGGWHDTCRLESVIFTTPQGETSHTSATEQL